MIRILSLAALLVACGDTSTPEPPAPAPAAEAPAEKPTEEPKAEKPAEAPAMKVFFVSPKDGDTVKSPVKIQMGVDGMEVKAAGDVVAGTGHHHVIIGPAGIATGEQVPKDEKHIHFGKGQTEAEVPLEPGEHKITLQFADGSHISYGEVGAATITITVEE